MSPSPLYSTYLIYFLGFIVVAIPIIYHTYCIFKERWDQRRKVEQAQHETLVGLLMTTQKLKKHVERIDDHFAKIDDRFGKLGRFSEEICERLDMLETYIDINNGGGDNAAAADDAAADDESNDEEDYYDNDASSQAGPIILGSIYNNIKEEEDTTTKQNVGENI